MVVRVAERAACSGALRVMVATDHADIAAACTHHGIEVFMTRADHASGTDRIAEVAALIGLPADAVIVNLQGDEPLSEVKRAYRVMARLYHPDLNPGREALYRMKEINLAYKRIIMSRDSA